MMQIHCKEVAAKVNCCKYVANGAGDCIVTVLWPDCVHGGHPWNGGWALFIVQDYLKPLKMPLH